MTRILQSSSNAWRRQQCGLADRQHQPQPVGRMLAHPRSWLAGGQVLGHSVG